MDDLAKNLCWVASQLFTIAMRQLIESVARAVGQLILSESQTFKGADNTHLRALPLFLKGNKI
jgi:hypothetical protein